MIHYIIIIIFIFLIISQLVIKKTFNNKIAIISMIKNPKNIEEWINYHISKGVSRFYIRLEDTPELESFLSSHKNVFLEIGSSKDNINKPTIDYAAAEFFQRQCDWIDKAIKLAIKDNIQWVTHIDCDELIDCEGSIQSNLQKESSILQETYVIPNYEAKYENVPTKTDSCFKYKKLNKCSEGSCISYANGKSIAKVSEYLKQAGAHRFYHKDDKKEVELKTIRLLHFESCDFDQYVSKYIDLAKTTEKKFPFPFYNDSINIAKSDICKTLSEECINSFKYVYQKYKII